MKYEELAFVNQQLAGMLKAGIPLEGSLKQLCETMQEGKLRVELELLEKDLAQGTPIATALAPRQFPEFYKLMINVGIKSNNLPGVLLMLADYYSRMDSLWSRLKGLMVYPIIVLGAMSVVSAGVAIIVGVFLLGKDGVYHEFIEQPAFGRPIPMMSRPEVIVASLSLPVVILVTLTILAICAVSIPRWYERIRWKLPGFHETSLSQLAMTISLLLRGGNTLHDALGIARQMERNGKVGEGLAVWQSRIAAGAGRIEPKGAIMYGLPPLFLWIVNGCGEDLARGFAQASELYQRRANHRIELMLYAALPVAVVILGSLILFEATPAFQALIHLMDAIGDTGA